MIKTDLFTLFPFLFGFWCDLFYLVLSLLIFRSWLSSIPWPGSKIRTIFSISNLTKIIYLNILRKIFELDFQQITNFSANCFEVENQDGHRKLIISTRGWASLTPAQQAGIQGCCDVITAAVDTVENVGGGGVRCMITGIYSKRVKLD